MSILDELKWTLLSGQLVALRQSIAALVVKSTLGNVSPLMVHAEAEEAILVLSPNAVQ